MRIDRPSRSPFCTLSLLAATCLVPACGSSSGEGSPQPTSEPDPSGNPTTTAPSSNGTTSGTSAVSPSSSPGTDTSSSVGSDSVGSNEPGDPSTNDTETAPGTAPGPTSTTEPVSPTSPTGETPAPSPGGGCTVGAWPSRDPAATGPFTVITEENVGPAAGEGADGEPVPFTVFRPSELGGDGLCHPVVTWGNGTGSTPNLYRVLLGHLASHGFIVVASNSPNVARGNPPPMVAGVAWLAEQNADPSSPYYQKVDTSHAGGTGHSQGGFATTSAAGDERITTIAPLCGASAQRNLHGPALLLCGGLDDVVTCESIQRSFDAVTNQPVMLANHLTSDHANWVTFRGTTLSEMEVATVAWMRLHLMGDTELRSWFYGPECELCTNDAWEITRKMMDE